ncbi:hypothetical protein BMETH_314111041733, partial [methanotrophic bacterial endosymbiont of Bathymodiolus sp.]
VGKTGEHAMKLGLPQKHPHGRGEDQRFRKYNKVT